MCQFHALIKNIFLAKNEFHVWETFEKWKNIVGFGSTPVGVSKKVEGYCHLPIQAI